MFFSPKSFLPIKYSKTIQLYSNLNTEDCFVQLTKHVPQSSIAVQFGVGSHLIRGEVGISNFWITRNMDRNSWRVKLEGHLVSEATGTRIVCKFATASWVEPSMSCMVIGVFITVSLALLYMVYDIFLGRFRGDWLGGFQQFLPFLIGYSIFFIFTRAFQLAGRNSTEDDEKYLIKFLEMTIGAKPVE